MKINWQIELNGLMLGIAWLIIMATVVALIITIVKI